MRYIILALALTFASASNAQDPRALISDCILQGDLMEVAVIARYQGLSEREMLEVVDDVLVHEPEVAWRSKAAIRAMYQTPPPHPSEVLEAAKEYGNALASYCIQSLSGAR